MWYMEKITRLSNRSIVDLTRCEIFHDVERALYASGYYLLDRSCHKRSMTAGEVIVEPYNDRHGSGILVYVSSGTAYIYKAKGDKEA